MYFSKNAGVKLSDKLVWGFLTLMVLMFGYALISAFITGDASFPTFLIGTAITLLGVWGVNRMFFSSIRIENNRFIYKNLLGERINIDLNRVATIGNVSYKTKFNREYQPTKTESMEFIMDNGENIKVSMGRFKENSKAEIIEYIIKYLGEKQVENMVN